ncbi:peptide-methionine (S)-S-oxide reductase [Candidatus Roizmanbacteria bacterium RIFCSPHIGHO2_01_FULL_38_15]|nr:MAG: peptide-methionine (S)-S-oxide reductase [Candidatus Roizmanbacteria bacterium RIFCSPHIGHO2_01_FULL_38_15]OGK34438.1 MAG: peptide-methionine (S)-S-oxide reductase [Candidatus Roizmanbacteria bacterium RIFCSPHIGHO2_12_FULL_38_13]
MDLKKATFGMGCFWCTEAVFQELKGVKKVTSGYSGGKMKSPTYEDVSSGQSGHAEVSQIEYDPKEISYEDLLYVFWRIHNPTTLNQQGADVGTHYRSVIFYHDEEQKKLAERTKKKAQKLYDEPIVTEIVPFKEFFPAENYHQEFYKKNKYSPYCQIVIDPKIQKLRKMLSNKTSNK